MVRCRTIQRALICDLGRTNQSILFQKLALMDSISSHLGSSQTTMELYRRKCHVVGASIGQHFRHSLDHIERAAAAAAAAIGHGSDLVSIHYDIRNRDTPDETDWNAAKTRIDLIDRTLGTLTLSDHRDDTIDQGDVNACFYLNGGQDAKEVALPSTLARELGFAAHHAIHHMAMVRIVVQQQGLSSVIPSDFGRAPSTIRYDGAVSQHK